MKRLGSYDKYLLASLKNPLKASEYLNACIEGAIADDLTDKEMKKIILVSLKNVIDAWGGVDVIAKKSGIHRSTLYGIISGKGNPSLTNLIKISNALGLQLNWRVDAA